MRPKLPEDLIKFILFQTAHLLKDLKAVGILYRDLKLSNIIIDSSFRVKFVDFGLSKRIKHERTSSVCGSAHALPPDLFAINGYSYSVDAYALGVVAYELLVGSAPFGYKLAFEDINKNDYAKLKENIEAKVSAEAKDLVGGLLEKDEALRWTVEQALDHLFLSVSHKPVSDYVASQSQKLGVAYPQIKEDIELVEDTAEETADDNMIQF